MRARSILDDLIVVEKGIATYEIHPVGSLWLKRKTDIINKKGLTKSFVTVWTTDTKEPPSDDLVLKQNNRLMELWNEGSVENVYFDIAGTQEQNAKTDFVFFLNTNSLEEAKNICNSLPFSKEGIASYDIYPAGVFWMGIAADH